MKKLFKQNLKLILNKYFANVNIYYLNLCNQYISDYAYIYKPFFL